MSSQVSISRMNQTLFLGQEFFFFFNLQSKLVTGASQSLPFLSHRDSFVFLYKPCLFWMMEKHFYSTSTSHCGISVHLSSTFPLPTSISRGETKMSLQPESHLCTPVIYGCCLLCSQHSSMDCNPPGQGEASLNQGVKTWDSDFWNTHFSPHCWPKSSRACCCLQQKQPWTELTTAIVKSIFVSFTPAWGKGMGLLLHNWDLPHNTGKTHLTSSVF